MEWRHTVWPEAGLVYTAIAKVANTSAKSALLESFLPDEPRGNPHAEGLGYREVDPAKMRQTHPSLFNVAIVRNPFDRMVSFWGDKIVGSGYYRGFSRLGLRRGMSFEETVRAATQVPDHRTDPHLRSQTAALLTEDRRLRPDLLLRFENLETDWSILQRVVEAKTGGRLADLPRRRTSDRQDWREYYTEETVELVARRYRRDFARLRYGLPDETLPGQTVLDGTAGRAVDLAPARAPGPGAPRPPIVLDLVDREAGVRRQTHRRGGLALSRAIWSGGQLPRLRPFVHGRLPTSVIDVLVLQREQPRSEGDVLAWLADQVRGNGGRVVLTERDQVRS